MGEDGAGEAAVEEEEEAEEESGGAPTGKPGMSRLEAAEAAGDTRRT